MDESWGTSAFVGCNMPSFPFPSGPNISCKSIGQIFDIMWSNMTETILKSTLAREQIDWDMNDINLFLASLLTMGLAPEPSIEDYFKQDARGIFGSLWMQQRFTKQKWSFMHSHIHFDPTECINILRTNAQSSWNLRQVLVVDELMVTFTGKWKWIQFIKGKPHNTGLKFFGLTDDSFYLWDFWLYQGSESNRSGKPAEIVLDFMKTVETNGGAKPHVVVVDSYYGSLKLAKKLHELKYGFLLSCKSDRPVFLFSDYLHNGLIKGEFSFIHNRNFAAMTYYDKAKVNLITNLFNTCQQTVNSTNTKKLPLGIYYYRKWFGGLDHFDRWLHLYLFNHRNIKWTEALLNTMLKIAVNNTHIIATYLGFETNLKQTILELIDHLSQSTTLRNDENRPTYQKKKTGQGHFPNEISKSKGCVLCQSNGRKSNTSYECDICKVPLHPKCFKEYHQK